jgi:hypothetical protein
MVVAGREALPGVYFSLCGVVTLPWQVNDFSMIYEKYFLLNFNML